MLSEICNVLARTGTGSTKIATINEQLARVKRLDVDTARQKLEGKVPDATLAKVCNMIEHGVPELVEVSQVDPTQFATRAELDALGGYVKRLTSERSTQDEAIEDLRNKLAGEREAREAMAKRIEKLEAVVASAVNELPDPKKTTEPTKS